MKKRILTLLLAVTMTLTMFTACGGNNTDSSSPSNTDSETEEQIQAALSEFQTYIDNVEELRSFNLYKIDNSNIPVCIIYRIDGTEEILFYKNDKLYTYSMKGGITLLSSGLIVVGTRDDSREESVIVFLELKEDGFVEIASATVTDVEITNTTLDGKEVSQEEFTEFYNSIMVMCDYYEVSNWDNEIEDVETIYNRLIASINRAENK